MLHRDQQQQQQQQKNNNSGTKRDVTDQTENSSSSSVSNPMQGGDGGENQAGKNTNSSRHSSKENTNDASKETNNSSHSPPQQILTLHDHQKSGNSKTVVEKNIEDATPLVDQQLQASEERSTARFMNNFENNNNFTSSASKNSSSNGDKMASKSASKRLPQPGAMSEHEEDENNNFGNNSSSAAGTIELEESHPQYFAMSSNCNSHSGNANEESRGSSKVEVVSNGNEQLFVGVGKNSDGSHNNVAVESALEFAHDETDPNHFLFDDDATPPFPDDLEENDDQFGFGSGADYEDDYENNNEPELLVSSTHQNTSKKIIEHHDGQSEIVAVDAEIFVEKDSNNLSVEKTTQTPADSTTSDHPKTQPPNRKPSSMYAFESRNRKMLSSTLTNMNRTVDNFNNNFFGAASPFFPPRRTVGAMEKQQQSSVVRVSNGNTNGAKPARHTTNVAPLVTRKSGNSNSNNNNNIGVQKKTSQIKSEERQFGTSADLNDALDNYYDESEKSDAPDVPSKKTAPNSNNIAQNSNTKRKTPTEQKWREVLPKKDGKNSPKRSTTNRPSTHQRNSPGKQKTNCRGSTGNVGKKSRVVKVISVQAVNEDNNTGVSGTKNNNNRRSGAGIATGKKSVPVARPVHANNTFTYARTDCPASVLSTPRSSKVNLLNGMNSAADSNGGKNGTATNTNNVTQQPLTHNLKHLNLNPAPVQNLGITAIGLLSPRSLAKLDLSESHASLSASNKPPSKSVLGKI